MRKRIIITGSTRGIGRGLAEEFCKRGHAVLINGRNSEDVEKLVGTFRGKGYEVSGMMGDVRDDGFFEELLSAAAQAFGGVDIFINNAGVPQSNRFFMDLEPEEIRRLSEVNITAVMLGTRAALRFFREQGHGMVFNMEGFGSDGRMMDKLGLYGSSKRTVNYFSKTVSKEVKNQFADQENAAIRVGILSPGMVRTAFIEHGSLDADPEELKRHERVFSILAEDVETVVPFLVEGMLNSRKPYDRIVFLTFRRLFPKLLRLMFVRS